MRTRDDSGSVLATTMATAALLALFSVTMLTVANHSSDATGWTRARSQALHAAEAGVAAVLQRLETNDTCTSTKSAPVNLTEGSKVVANYQWKVTAPGGVCSGDTRVITSWGNAPNTDDRARQAVEMTVKLTPRGGFPWTLFAEGSYGLIDVKNNATITGDAYAESLDQSMNNLSARNVVTQGSIITKNNAVYTGMLWAAGNINLGTNSNVTGSAMAAGTTSTGTLTLGNNSVVGGDAIAKSTITKGSGVVVSGTTSANNPNTPVPPDLKLPVFTWNPANYTPAPVTFATATLANTWLAANSSNLGGTLYIPSAGGVVNMPSGTVTSPLTIVTTGKIQTPGSTNLTGSHPVTLIALNTASDAIACKNNCTFAPGLTTLFYTTGGVEMKNSASLRGSIYANLIDFKNSSSVSRAPELDHTFPAGFDFTNSGAVGFVPVPISWREVPPG